MSWSQAAMWFFTLMGVGCFGIALICRRDFDRLPPPAKECRRNGTQSVGTYRHE